MKLLLEKKLDLRALYIHQVRSMLSAEEQILDGLDKMVKTASDTELKATFQTHRQESEGHVMRLKQILHHTAGEADAVKCKAVAALINEAEELIQESDRGPLRDAAMITAAQRIEHYEMASYGALRNFARMLQLAGDAESLEQTLEEERHADQLLTSISEHLNHEAMKLA
jgi:ferritin-like metal-binding protein YciE